MVFYFFVKNTTLIGNQLSKSKNNNKKLNQATKHCKTKNNNHKSIKNKNRQSIRYF